MNRDRKALPWTLTLATMFALPVKEFLISYNYAGSQWNITIMAEDHAGAEKRVRALAYAKVDGELIAKIPAHSGWLAPLIAWLRNLFVGCQS